MSHGTDQPTTPTSPLTDDAHAGAQQLLAAAAADYREAQTRREQLDREDRVHGQEAR